MHTHPASHQGSQPHHNDVAPHPGTAQAPHTKTTHTVSLHESACHALHERNTSLGSLALAAHTAGQLLLLLCLGCLLLPPPLALRGLPSAAPRPLLLLLLLVHAVCLLVTLLLLPTPPGGCLLLLVLLLLRLSQLQATRYAHVLAGAPRQGGSEGNAAGL